MWECKNCGFKNGNSNLKCHGVNCKAERKADAIEQPYKVTKEHGMKKVFDYCNKCCKDTFWIATRYKGKKAWRCMSCQRTAFLIGKPKPFPIEVENI